MPCNLVIPGKDLDIDSFISRSGLLGYSKRYKGEAKFKNRPQGKKPAHSSLRIETSKADFDNLEKQIKGTIRYLKKHRERLRYIKKTKEIELALLDFGINLRIDRENTLMQSEKFPSELLQLAGELGLDIKFSIYPTDLQSILENMQAIKKEKGLSDND